MVSLTTALYIGGGCLVLLIAVWFFLKRQDKIKQVRMVLFEHIGGDKVFRGIFVVPELDDPKLGIHLKLSKDVAITDIDSRDYFSDLKYGKCILVCKYSKDDYRVIARRGEEYYKILQTPIYEEVKNPNFNPNDPNSLSVLKRIKQDADGNQVFDQQLVPFQESIGVDQDSRTATRFNRMFKDRMLELMKEKQSLMSKLLPIAGIIFVGLILLIGFVYMSKTQKETMIQISKDFKAGADSYQNDNFFARITEWAQTRGVDANEPPK